MGILHNFLAAGHIPLRITNRIGRRIGLRPDGCLRVLTYHGIAPLEENRFANQLKWLSKSWRFISPELFVAMIQGNEPIRGNNLLVTFDDGLLSNRWAAETILNSLGVKALFFVPTDFIEIKDPIEQRGFMARNIWPGTDPSTIAPHLRSMNWDDLSFLLEEGHSIGAHTKSHPRLSELEFEPDLVEEIVGSGDRLESKLGVSIRHFAFPFGNLTSFTPKALKVARRRFEFIYSVIRGDNVKTARSWAIRRDPILPSDSLNLVGALLEGGADILYSRRARTLESWGTEIKFTSV
ncbi:MAG: polysaccharide deacetylase family protein [Desulfomonilaceae bacterium]